MRSPSIRFKLAKQATFLSVALLAFVALLALNLIGSTTSAQQIPVIHQRGALQGLLLLKNGEGRDIAIGDQTQEVEGNEVHSRLIFRFRDGSIDDETTVYRQDSVFQLIRDHHIQKGPSFPHPIDVTIDVPASKVTWIETSHKKSQAKSQHMDLPSDLANGMISLLVEDFPHKDSERKVSYLVPGSKPRIVQLSVTPEGTDRVLVGWSGRRVAQYDVHFEIGGIAGVVAHVFGKQPPDIHLWALEGTIPQLVKLVGPLYEQGPIWTMTQTAPTWPTSEKGD
jgi:hypothetical protein